MMRKFGVLAAGVALGAALAGGVAQVHGTATAAGSDTYRNLNLFGDVFERIRADYVEEPKEDELVEAAINGMLTSLDPHSSYMNAKSFGDMQVQTRGEFGGLGIEVTMENELIKVVTPIDDTPAARAGVLAGDLITHLNDEPVAGMSLKDAVDKMRGPRGSSIKLTITREGAAEPIKLDVVRDIIEIKAVRHRIEDDIGYIRITQFNEKTVEGIDAAIADIEAKVPADKLKGYVLDLRNNPGGLLDQAIGASDAFLERGEIVSTRGRRAEETQRFTARAGDETDGKPIVVLVNGGSASASEIVAGALQDHRRATVIGSRSFGKGSVQTIIPLGRDGAIRLTTARYYTPAGRSIQAKGIEPDIAVEQPLPEELKGKADNIGEASLRGHLESDDEANGNKAESGSSAYVPPEPKDDKQLIYAYELLRGVQKHSAFPATPEQGVPN